MPEAQILLCGTAQDSNGSQQSLEFLKSIQLANAAKFVVTTGKFDTHEFTRKFNVEADYPAEPAHLQTLAAWAELADGPETRLRDGYDLFCLRRIIAKHGGFSHALLLRHGAEFTGGVTGLVKSIGKNLFRILDAPDGSGAARNRLCNVLFSLNHPDSAEFLDRARDLYETGAVYAMEDYAFETALRAAAESVQLVAEMIEQEQQSQPRRNELSR